MSKPAAPKGTRDFLPLQARRREYIFSTIRRAFEKYGYEPIETPAMEMLSTLTGKYGEEGDRLIFKILDSGDATKNLFSEQIELIKNGSSDQSELIVSLKETVAQMIVPLEDLFRGVIYTPLDEEFKRNFPNRLLEFTYDMFARGERGPLFSLQNAQPTFFDFLVLAIGDEYLSFLEAKRATDADDTISYFDRLSGILAQTDHKGKLYALRQQYASEFVEHCEKSIALIGVSAFMQKYYLSRITSKALRYDLTVPFARFVVNHFNELTFPFKRYQIQPVWRADRPQKGRYREFYQCDADVVGSTSLLYEVEMIQLFDEVLSDLQLSDFTIKINNRKILSGVAEVAGISDRFSDLTVAIDKLDKIGQEGVVKELQDRGISQSVIDILQPLFSDSGSNSEKMAEMRSMLQSSTTGMSGLEEVGEVLRHIDALGLRKAKLQVDFTLARGLDYYTGAIFEVVAGGVNIGSICGGGRYDDLTSIFGRDNLPGVGISFGADRIYDVLNELSLFPENLTKGPQVLFINFGPRETDFALGLLKSLRQAGIVAEIYPETAKMKKQMKYADDKKVRFVALAGENEIKADAVTIKDMETGAQQEMPASELIAFLRT